MAHTIGNLKVYYETKGDSVKLCALSSVLQVLEDDFSEVEKIVRGKSSIIRIS